MKVEANVYNIQYTISLDMGGGGANTHCPPGSHVYVI